MLGRTRATAKDHEAGFSLIELLVVIVLMGLVMAIAIPVFLNQRRTGFDTGVKTDLRNAAGIEENWLTETGTYTSSIDNLKSDGFRYGDASNYAGSTATITATFTGGDKFCLTATSKSGTTFRFTDSNEYVSVCP
jgi:type IV pilus assembly protein PilA